MLNKCCPVSLLVLSETTDSTEEEWQSIADLATACRSILEALSREGEHWEAAGPRTETCWAVVGRTVKRAALRMLKTPFLFLHSDRKAWDQAGDQSDGKLRDSKER